MTHWTNRMNNAWTEACKLVKRLGAEATAHRPVEDFADWLGLDILRGIPLRNTDAQLLVGPLGASIVLSQRVTDQAEERWAIAHELGHYVLDHPSPPAAELCLPSPASHQLYEAEANGFASALMFPERAVRAFCDMRPMTLAPSVMLAEMCGAPWRVSARALTGASWLMCALVVSKACRVELVSPSLPFLMFAGQSVWPASRVSYGSLAHRFFCTGYVPPREGVAALVPASAWIDGCDPGLALLEHSIVRPEHGVVITMLSVANYSLAPRPAIATVRNLTIARDVAQQELKEARFSA